MIYVELGEDGIPTQRGSIAIKASLYAHWFEYGLSAPLPRELREIQDSYPLEADEAYFEAQEAIAVSRGR